MEHDGGAAIAWGLETWYEVEAAAKWCVEHGVRGERGDPLPEGLSSRAHKIISADIYGFIRRVERIKRGRL
jgi:hypothetical protein